MNPYSDYYVFQFMDGTWRIAPMAAHHINGKPDLPWVIREGVYATQAAAYRAISIAADALGHGQWKWVQS